MAEFKEIRAWQCNVCGEIFEDVCQAEGCADVEPRCPWHELHAPKELELTETHLRLLRSGVRYQYIGLSDNMGIRTGELVALGELEHAGLVEPTTDELPPGPPSMTPSVITDKGRAVLIAAAGG